MHQHDSRPVVLTSDVLSPELVLVDERLAQDARSGLEIPRDTLARIESLPRPRAAELSVVVADAELPSQPEGLRPRRLAIVRTRARGVVLVGAVVAVACGVLLLRSPGQVEGGLTVADPVESVPGTVLGTTPSEPASTSAPSSSGTVAPPVTRSSSTAEGKSTTGTQRFAWAPVPGASGYHVKLFADSTLVFTTETKGPQMLVPRRWTHAGNVHRLDPGAYRWLVWAKVAGVRQSEAVVQAQLVIPAR